MNYPIQLNAKGVKVIHVLGFQTESAVFYENNFAKMVKHILQL